MTPELINAVYDILVQEAGAPEFKREMFLNGMFPEDSPEFRFAGRLGLGGKVWFQEHPVKIAGQQAVYVNCYSEDLTPGREAIINRTNKLLAELMEGKK